MTRKIRTLGIALVAICAVSAVSASAAMAEGQFAHWANMGKAAFSGSQVGTNVFNIPEGNTECAQASFVGGPEVETEETTAQTITIKPTYSSCKFKGTAGTEVDVNGCDFNVHLNVVPPTITVICPKEKQITITVKVGGITKCTIHIPPQDIKGGLQFVNNGTKQAVKIVAAVKNITSVVTTGEGLGACTATADDKVGELNGQVEVTGTAGGAASSIWVE